MLKSNQFQQPDFSRLKNYFISDGVLKTFNRKTNFIEYRSIPKHVGLVDTGLFRSILIDKKGRQQVFDFSSPGEIIHSLCPLQQRTRSEYYVQSLENSSIYCLTHEEINLFFDTDNETKQLKISFMETYALYLQKRLLFIYSNPTMEDRLLSLLSEYPNLFDYYPQQEIASFIGCSPECFSRIRKGLKVSAKINHNR